MLELVRREARLPFCESTIAAATDGRQKRGGGASTNTAGLGPWSGPGETRVFFVAIAVATFVSARLSAANINDSAAGTSSPSTLIPRAPTTTPPSSSPRSTPHTAASTTATKFRFFLRLTRATALPAFTTTAPGKEQPLRWYMYKR